MIVPMARVLRFGLTLAAALLVIGCAARSPSSPLATAAPTASATSAPSVASVTIPDALRGEWTAEVTGTTASSGLWVLRITESNVFLKNPVPSGDFFSLDPTSVTDETITFSADSECPDQTTVTEGAYSLAVEDATLVITLVGDSCGDRSAVLVAGPWTRLP